MSDMDYVTKTLVFSSIILSSLVDKCETFKTPDFVSLEHIVESKEKNNNIPGVKNSY